MLIMAFINYGFHPPGADDADYADRDAGGAGFPDAANGVNRLDAIAGDDWFFNSGFRSLLKSFEDERQTGRTG